MGIIAKLKDVLGIAERPAQPRRAESTDVTVERETDPASERAVKGVESDRDDEPTPEPAQPAEPGDSVEAGDTEAAVGGADAGVEPSDDSEPVDSIKGIGSSYAERLGEAGVDTVADLAAADAEEVSEATGIGAGRIGNWIERAKVRNR